MYISSYSIDIFTVMVIYLYERAEWRFPYTILDSGPIAQKVYRIKWVKCLI